MSFNVGMTQQKKVINFGTDSDHILDTKNPTFLETC